MFNLNLISERLRPHFTAAPPAGDCGGGGAVAAGVPLGGGGAGAGAGQRAGVCPHRERARHLPDGGDPLGDAGPLRR